MKIKRIIMLVLVLLSGSVILAQEDLKIAKGIQGTQSSSVALSTRDTLFAHAGQTQLSCPETIVVGVITPPAGWTDYNRRVVPFESLSVVNTAQGAKISCNYDGGRYALDRLVPGRVCTRNGATSPYLSCRVVPSKK